MKKRGVITIGLIFFFILCVESRGFAQQIKPQPIERQPIGLPWEYVVTVKDIKIVPEPFGFGQPLQISEGI
jgi:hypothetical protein